MDYCQSSEDYLKFEGSLMDQTLAQHLHDSAAGQSQSANRAVSALLGQVQSAATARAQLFPLDMQGNQILLYSQASGLSLDAAAAPSRDGRWYDRSSVFQRSQSGARCGPTVAAGRSGSRWHGQRGDRGWQQRQQQQHWGFWENVYVPLW